jgi:hypothetical protein
MAIHTAIDRSHEVSPAFQSLRRRFEPAIGQWTDFRTDDRSDADHGRNTNDDDHERSHQQQDAPYPEPPTHRDLPWNENAVVQSSRMTVREEVGVTAPLTSRPVVV